MKTQKSIKKPISSFKSELNLVEIIISNKIIVPSIVYSLNLQENTLALIGMDIIKQGSFLVQNKKGKIVFQYSKPSLEELNYIDFLKLESNENEKNRKKLKKINPKHPMIDSFFVNTTGF